MSFFKKAKREQIWLKILLGGSSGSGKTYSALRLASGISKKSGGKIATIDTENGRIRYYANEFEFDDMQLEYPYTPEKFIEAIEESVDEGYNVLIIDSISHEWECCLELHSRMPGNSYTNWGKITPRHDRFMEKVLQSPIHIISCARGKDEYVLVEEKGKQVPKKVGVGIKARDNTEYNYTVSFNIDQKTHIADVTKDNTHLFEDKYEMLTEKDGIALYDWANTGDAPIKKTPIETHIAIKIEEPQPKVVPSDFIEDYEETVNFDEVSTSDELKKSITEKAMTLETDKKKLFTTKIKEMIGKVNYNNCDDIDKLQEILTLVKSL